LKKLHLAKLQNVKNEGTSVKKDYGTSLSINSNLIPELFAARAVAGSVRIVIIDFLRSFSQKVERFQRNWNKGSLGKKVLSFSIPKSTDQLKSIIAISD